MSWSGGCSKGIFDRTLIPVSSFLRGDEMYWAEYVRRRPAACTERQLG